MKNIIESQEARIKKAITELSVDELKKLCAEMPLNTPVYYFNLALDVLEKRLSSEEFVKLCESLD